ncbi:MAG TPA: AraC family ligand binding domain-containing protein, partial [Terriglobales bacterium]|nr:AraC family ligand binding domain-containing protein [Terriglobales bacterium]
MRMGPETAPNLLFGSFYGVSNVKREFAGFSASLMVPEVPAREMPVHTHEDASFVIVLRGVYISSAKGAENALGDCAVIYNPPGTKHRDCFRELEGAQFLGISISHGNLQHAAEAVRLPDRATCYRGGEILLTARRIARQCRQWADGASLFSEALCWELLAHAGRVQEYIDKATPAWLYDVRESIRENCSARIQISDMAAVAEVHPVYLVRRFRECFGCTPGE